MTRTLTRLFLSAALAAVLGSFGALAQAVDYVAIDLNPSGYNYSEATSVNGSLQVGNGNGHAMIWNSKSDDFLDLHPSNCDIVGSRIFDISGSQMVGSGYGRDGGYSSQHAFLWNNMTNNIVDLNPNGYQISLARGTNGNQQVGSAMASNYITHAMIWNGTAESVIDLNPSVFGDSYAYAISGTQQVGFGRTFEAGEEHALLWKGSAESYVDLNPIGYQQSIAFGTNGVQQVGFASNIHGTHAILWNSSADNYVDLHPYGFGMSEALDINGNQQVGYGQIGYNIDHALVWNGTAESAVDLHKYLPEGFPEEFIKSYAQGIDDQGNIVGYVSNDNGLDKHAILWVPVPEPSAFVLLGIGALSLIVCRLRRKAG